MSAKIWPGSRITQLPDYNLHYSVNVNILQLLPQIKYVLQNCNSYGLSFISKTSCDHTEMRRPTKSPMLMSSPQYQSGPNLVLGTSNTMSLRPGKDMPTL